MRRSTAVGAGGFLAIALLAAGFFGLSVFIHYSTQETAIYEVTGAERICSGSSDGNSSCQYLVYTTSGTLSNTDSLLAGKFRSSDWHGQFREGGTYRFTTTGWRIGWLSAYPNIIEQERLSPGQLDWDANGPRRGA